MATQPRAPEAINQSGVQPLDLRVLVIPDKPGEKRGLILMPDSVRDQEKFAMQKGTLVAIGENAWEEAAARSAAFRKPAPGDRVMIGKYAGSRITGLDGADYLLMNDEDVIGRLSE